MTSCSVIIPIYKGNKYIPKLISMIQRWMETDEHPRLEMILVNDFPDEPIVLPPSSGQSKVSIHVINNERNMGIHYSRIVGVQHATGDFVLFLDQDDTLSGNYLSSQLRHIQEGDAVICNGLYRNGERIYSPSNPMRSHFSLEDYLQNGYPLISLGQLLIKRNRIPQQWLQHVMVHNGWDDAFLWALMMVHQVKVSTNEDILYIHEEDGNNASFNWNEMALSGKNFRDLFLKLNVLDETQERKFRDLVESKILKYEIYDELDTYMNQVTAAQLEQYLISQNIHHIAVYGIGVYGKKLCSRVSETGIKVKYCIDKRHDVKDFTVPVVPLVRGLERVDAIVVTPVSAFEEIEQQLKKVCAYKVISLLDMLRDIKGTMQ